MPVDRSQPVYPPSKGEDILATWGDQVSEHVVQRFATAVERDAKWANPPKGAMCVTTDTVTTWKYDGNNWRSMPDGVVGWTEWTGRSATHTGGLAAGLSLTGLALTGVPVKAGHLYEIRVNCRIAVEIPVGTSPTAAGLSAFWPGVKGYNALSQILIPGGTPVGWSATCDLTAFYRSGINEAINVMPILYSAAGHPVWAEGNNGYAAWCWVRDSGMY